MSQPSTPAGAGIRNGLAGAGLVAVLAAVMAAFFLSLYPLRDFTLPLGFDTPRYVWRTNCVAGGGLDALESCGETEAEGLPTRVAYPIVALELGAVLHGSPFAMAAVVPVAAAALIGLGAAAFVTTLLRRGPGSFAVVAGIVGTSLVVVRLAAPEGYQDNLLGLALCAAGLAAVVPVVFEGRGYVAAAGLLSAGAIAHWPTFLIVAAALAVTALLHLPRALGERRAGRSWLATVPGRLTIVGAGTVAGWGAALAALGSLPVGFAAEESELGRKAREDVPRYLYPLTIPAAALGAWRVTREKGEARPRARFVLVLFAAWVAIIVGAVLVHVLEPTIALHRFLILALPVPILGAVALLWAGELAESRSRVLAIGVVAAGTVISAGLGYRLWNDFHPFIEGAKLAEAASAGRYVAQETSPGTPVIVAVDGVGGNPRATVKLWTNEIRSVFPPERIADTVLYLGRRDRLLAGEPTITDYDPRFDEVSAEQLDKIRPLLSKNPVVLLIRSFYPLFDEELSRFPEIEVAPGVLDLRGAPPSDRLPASPAPSAAGGGARLFGLAFGGLALLGAIGAGWALAGLRRSLRPFEIAALAPALGVAALIAAGIVADALGVRLTGAAGTLVVAGAGLPGYAAWGIGKVRGDG